jgi:hypothetical protein
MTPRADPFASLQKNGHPNPRPVMNGKSINVKDEAFCLIIDVQSSLASLHLIPSMAVPGDLVILVPSIQEYEIGRPTSNSYPQILVLLGV